MIGSIILALIAGAIIGLVARLVMPGKQNISMVATVLIGALGGLIGSVVASQFGYHNANGGVAWIPFFIRVVAAIALIAVYESVMGRRTGILGRRGSLIGRRGSLLGRRGGTGITGRRGRTRLPW
ncbi:MAG TPA: GlsB/YeaQ/YmgE family stress response membrane protein [Mycobacterium sp.]|nr:GlsB/YeaQ/YmgE family stress response membrane protein [Mycobacterium sp.]